MNISRRECLTWFLAGLSPSLGAPSSLEQQWHRFASQTDGIVGAAALHLKSGMLVSMNGGARFPLASVCKLPIAMHILAMVDEGKLHLTDTIEIPRQAVWPNVSVIAERWPTVNSFKLDEVLSLMVAKSDNTAVETLWHIGGGAAAMANRFRQWRIAGIRLDRSERECGLNSLGVKRLPKWEEWTPTLVEELTSRIPVTERRAAIRAFLSDPRDTATPDATVELLKRMYRGELLSASSTGRLIQILESTATGGARLKGLLPAGTTVAHKTGTTATEQGLNGGTNDVGVVTLPDGDRFAIAAYIKGSTQKTETVEKVIAQISRAAFDTWKTS
jgi:beta-lactamase class A